MKPPETLEATITRVIADARAVDHRVTPRALALAIAGAGWTHRSAVPTVSRAEEPEEPEEPRPPQVTARDRETAARINRAVAQWYSVHKPVTAVDLRTRVDRIHAARKGAS